MINHLIHAMNKAIDLGRPIGAGVALCFAANCAKYLVDCFVSLSHC